MSFVSRFRNSLIPGIMRRNCPPSTTLLVLIVVCLSSSTALWSQQEESEQQAKRTARQASLKISGTVTSVRIDEGDNTVNLHVGVNLVAENAGQEPIILFNRAPAINAEYLFTTPTGGLPLWVAEHHTAADNNSGKKKARELKEGLDQKEPPDDLTILLGPGDSVGWDVPLELTFHKTVEPREVQVGTPPRPVWDAVKRSCPCWLKLDLDLWPASIEPKPDADDPALARKLAARWKKKGTLLFDEHRSEGIPMPLEPMKR